MSASARAPALGPFLLGATQSRESCGNPALMLASFADRKRAADRALRGGIRTMRGEGARFTSSLAFVVGAEPLMPWLSLHHSLAGLTQPVE